VYESHELGLAIRAELSRRRQAASIVIKILAFTVCERYLLRSGLASLRKPGGGCRHRKLPIT
jgi:hypothetical protein